MRLSYLATLIAVLLTAAGQSVGAQTNPNPFVEKAPASQASNSPQTEDLSADPPGLDEIDKLNRQILRKEIELERLNTRFRMETSLVSPWRQRRMFMYSQTSAWLTEVSLISQMKIRYKLAKEKRPRVPQNVIFNTDEDFPEGAPAVDFDNDGDSDDDDSNEFAAIQDGDFSGSQPQNPSIPRIRRQNGKERGRLAAAAETQLVGQLIGASGDVFEIGLNFCNYLKLRHKELTPALYRKNVQVLHTELDNLFEARKKACAQAVLAPSDRTTVNAEGKLLTDLKDLELREYSEFHAATKNFWTLQNTAYLVDFSKNMFGVTSNIISLTGNHKRNPRMQGGAGIFSILSGTTVLLTPIVGRVTGNVSGLAARRLVSPELTSVATKDLTVFSSDREKLLSFIAKPSVISGQQPEPKTELATRTAIYEGIEKVMKETLRYQESQAKRAHATLIENVTFAGIVGPPRIANGICQVLGGWRYYTNHSLANKVFAAGATAYASGTAINILETARVQAAFERRYHTQRKTHSTSREQFLGRLKRLDEMHTLLSAQK